MRLPLLPAILALTASSVASQLAAAEPQILADPVLPPITPQADPAVVASAALFVSADQGATWTRSTEVAVAATGPAPAFRWTAPGDGSYAFVTPLRFRPGMGVDQAEPQAGQLPAHALRVIVDTTPPTVEVLGSDGVMADGALQVTVRWIASDAHFSAEPVTLEVSGDDGHSFSAERTLPPSGSITAKVTLATGVSKALIRLIARDRAGLIATTPATPVIATVPVDPVAALQKAVASLPAPALAVADTPTQSAAPKPAVPAVSTGSRSTPEIVAPNGSTSEPGPAAIETVGPESSVEDRYARTAYARPETPRGKSAVGQSGTQDIPMPAVEPESNAVFLTGAQARTLLAEARRAADAGDTAAALTAYVRLQSSDQGQIASSEEFALRRRGGDWAGLAQRSALLPLYLLSDDVRIDGATGLVRTGEHRAAIQLVSKVTRTSPRSREGALVLADAMEGNGDRAKALRLWGQLASGDDAIAEQARARLGK